MKHLMYLSITILCLSVSALIGFHLGVQKAEADFTPSGWVIGSHGLLALTSDGLCWQIFDDVWGRVPQYDLPIPTSDVKFWAATTIITTSDEGWHWQSGEWSNIGTPGGTSGVDATPTTWGQLKNKYQEEDK